MNHEEPAGTLRRLATPTTSDLDAVPLLDLVTAVRRRLAAGEGLGYDVDQLGLLSMEAELAGDVPGNRFSRARVALLAGMAEPLVSLGKLRIEGASVVELGCGSINPLGTLLFHVLAGAREAHGFDLDPPQDVRTAVRALARLSGYLLSEPTFLLPWLKIDRAAVARRLVGFDLLRMWQGEPDGIDERRLRLHRRSADDTGLPSASVDYAYSVSFLEHVPDVEAVAAELARITRPGGFGVHSIDGIDHWHYGDPKLHPLEFLRDPDGAALVHGSNRLRPAQFMPVFERHGFVVERFEVHDQVAISVEDRATFAAPFRDLPLEMLGQLTGVVTLRRR
jgi:SAM-dependent methyltransferase